MGKKKIIILSVIAVVSFAASYFVSPMLVGGGGGDSQSQATGGKQDATGADGLANGPILPKPREDSAIVMRGKELTSLITELKVKMGEFNEREKKLAEREKRVRIAGEVVQKQVQELDKLRVGLIPEVQRYQAIKKEVEASQTQITAAEDKNIKSLAARYDVMDSTGAAKILGDLWVSKKQDLAVKIFYYMQARSSAKVLAAISSSNEKGAAELAARLTEKFPTVRKPQKKG